MTVHDTRQRHLEGARVGQPVGGQLRIAFLSGPTLATALAVLTPPPAAAQSTDQTGNTSTDWTEGGNWSAGVSAASITTLATSYSGQIGDDTGDHGTSATLGAVLMREWIG